MFECLILPQRFAYCFMLLDFDVKITHTAFVRVLPARSNTVWQPVPQGFLISRRGVALLSKCFFLSPLALWPVSVVKYVWKEKLRLTLRHSCNSSLARSRPNYWKQTRLESWSPQGVDTAQRVCSSEVQTMQCFLNEWVPWWCPVLLIHPKLYLQLARCIHCYIIIWLSFRLPVRQCSWCPSTLFLCIISHLLK